MALIDVVSPRRLELGEGPYWDASAQRLLHVDILAGLVVELDPLTGADVVVEVGPPLSFVLPLVGRSEWIAGQGNDLIVVDRTGRVLDRYAVEPGRPDNRLNEGKADPQGRLWFGSMSLTREPDRARLYRLDDRGLHVEEAPITLGNGTDWDLERRRMYHVDSTTQRIDVLDHDITTGVATRRRPWAAIDPADGVPDGLTVDAEGCVWVCLFSGGAVRRYDPDGALMQSVVLPVSCPTSVAFGGPGLATLFVTSSRHRLDEAQRAAQPLAGAVLALDVGVAGRPAHPVGSTGGLLAPPAEHLPGHADAG